MKLIIGALFIFFFQVISLAQQSCFLTGEEEETLWEDGTYTCSILETCYDEEGTRWENEYIEEGPCN